MKIIPPFMIVDAFKQVSWNITSSQSGLNWIFSDKGNPKLWTHIPKEVKAVSEGEYLFLQDQAIKYLLLILDLPEDNDHYRKIYDQLWGYSYELSSRIQNKNQEDFVNFELATSFVAANLSCFKKFFSLKTKGKKNLPLHQFELKHTRAGSFIIPVSIKVENENNDDLDAALPGLLEKAPNTVGCILREYLETVDFMNNYHEDSKEEFAKKMYERNLDSTFVKGVLGAKGSIANIKDKFMNEAELIEIKGSGSPILDYGVKEKHLPNKDVNLNNMREYDASYIDSLEILETKNDENSCDEKSVEIAALADNINADRDIRFRVLSINGEEIDKPFKANANIPQNFFERCLDAMKNGSQLIISGDVEKRKRKTGRIWASDIIIKEDLFTNTGE